MKRLLIFMAGVPESGNVRRYGRAQWDFAARRKGLSAHPQMGQAMKRSA